MFIKTQAAQLKYVQFLLVNFNLNKPGKRTEEKTEFSAFYKFI